MPRVSSAFGRQTNRSRRDIRAQAERKRCAFRRPIEGSSDSAFSAVCRASGRNSFGIVSRGHVSRAVHRVNVGEAAIGGGVQRIQSESRVERTSSDGLRHVAGDAYFEARTEPM
jgi:hypothetical protein